MDEAVSEENLWMFIGIGDNSTGNPSIIYKYAGYDTEYE